MIVTSKGLYATALLPVLLLTAACGGDESAAPPPAPTTPKAAPATSTAPQPSPTPTPASLDDAADGRNLDACRDGTCEVVVKRGDELRFDKKFDTGPLLVLSAGERFSVTNTTTGFTSSISGGGNIQTGGIRIDLGESKGDRTALTISPRS